MVVYNIDRLDPDSLLGVPTTLMVNIGPPVCIPVGVFNIDGLDPDSLLGVPATLMVIIGPPVCIPMVVFSIDGLDPGDAFNHLPLTLKTLVKVELNCLSERYPIFSESMEKMESEHILTTSAYLLSTPGWNQNTNEMKREARNTTV